MAPQNLEPSESSQTRPLSARNPSYSHASPLNDTGLNGLRDQIKNVMIPLLIKVFQLKVELSQSQSLPSRLTHSKPKESSEEIENNLKRLDEDLKVLSLWCQSCRNQIGKALSPPEEPIKDSLSKGKNTQGSSHPAVSKSFSDAVSLQKEGSKKKKTLKSPPPPAKPPQDSFFAWLRKTLRM